MSEGVREQGELVTRSFGPFVKGLVDTWPASAGDPQGALRRAEGIYLWGEGQLRSMRFPWSREYALSDAANDPHTDLVAACNAVSYANSDVMLWYLVAFQATAASADVRDMQLYFGTNVLNPWWYGRTGGATPSGSVAIFCASISTIGAGSAPLEGSYRTAPIVRMVSVGLMLHIASDVVGGQYATVDTTLGPGAMVVTLAPGGVTVRGVFLFQRHVWGYGGANRSDGGKLWFGTPDYGALTTAAGNSFQLPGYSQGINSIYQVVVVRESAIICTARGYYRLTGYGKNTWQVTLLALRVGAAGYKAACSGPDAAYVLDASGRVWACTDDGVTALPRISSLADAQYDLSKAVLGYDDENQWLLVVIPLSQVTPLRSHVWTYDVQREQWTTAKTVIGQFVGAVATYAANDVREVFAGAINQPMFTAPTLTSVTASGGGVVSVTWALPALTGTPKLALEVKRTTDGESAWEVWEDISIGGGSPTSVSGFTAGVSYDFRLWMDFYTAARSAYSATATVVVT